MPNIILSKLGIGQVGGNSGHINSVSVSYQDGPTQVLPENGSVEIPPGANFKIWVDADAHCEYPGLDGGWAWAITIKGNGPLTIAKSIRSGVGHTFWGDKDWEDDNVVFPQIGWFVMPTNSDVTISRIRLWVNSKSQATDPNSDNW